LFRVRTLPLPITTDARKDRHYSPNAPRWRDIPKWSPDAEITPDIGLAAERCTSSVALDFLTLRLHFDSDFAPDHNSSKIQQICFKDQQCRQLLELNQHLTVFFSIIDIKSWQYYYFFLAKAKLYPKKGASRPLSVTDFAEI